MQGFVSDIVNGISSVFGGKTLDESVSGATTSSNMTGINNTTIANESDISKANAVRSQIASLSTGTVGSKEQADAATKAYNAYNSLSETQKSYISKDEVAKVTSANTSAQSYIKATTPTGITLSPTSLSIVAGKSGKITATISPSTATGTVSWASSNTSIATVSGGTVTGKNAGSVTITAKIGSVSASCNVTVTPAPVAQATTPTVTKTAAEIERDKIMAIFNSAPSRSKTMTSQEKKDHVPLWEYIVSHYGRKPSYAMYGQLADALGIKLANPSKATSSEKTKILNALKSKGYATGKRKVTENEVKWTQENGSEIIYRKSDGAMLTPLNPGDSVFTTEMKENLWSFAKNPSAFAAGKVNIELPDYGRGSENISPVINCAVNVYGNANEMDITNALKKMMPEINKSVQNSIRQDLRKSGRK